MDTPMPENQPITEASVREALAEFRDPETGRGIVQLDQVHKLTLDGQKLSVALGLTSWAAPLWEETRAELAAVLEKRFSGIAIEVDVELHARPAEKQGDLGVPAKSVIAVGSGKGGVGKSSIAGYLAFGLARAGAKVGLMDADVYGPSIPHLLGSNARPTMVDDRIQPILIDSVKVMSMGFLVAPDDPVIWRGPMLHAAMTQFLRDTAWDDLDYLIIDMPPGTGDIPLSLSQLLPLSGAVVVCTPQDVALLDATKAVGMMRKVDIDVVGMVENMSFFLCPTCETRHEIFGSGGAKARAEKLGVPFLGEVPLVTDLRVHGDQGMLTAALEHPTAGPYLQALSTNLVRTLVARRRQRPQAPELPILG